MDSILLGRYLTGMQAHGATPPEAATQAQELLRIAGEYVTAAPTAGIRGRLVAGELNADNVAEAVREEALDVLVRDGARIIVRDLQAPVANIIARAIRDDAGRIVLELRPAWDEAAERVTGAAEHFGPEDQAADVITRGPAAARAWAGLTDAAATLNGIAGIRRSLAVDFGYGDPELARYHPGLLYVTDVGAGLGALDSAYADVVEVTTRTSRGRLASPWLRMASEGWSLALNSDVEAAALLAAGLADQPALVYG